MKKIIILLILISTNIFANHETKLLNKEIIKTMKYSVDFEISIDDGKFPTEEVMQKIAYKEKLKNPGYENYFVSFYLPKMKINEGSFATSINNSGSNPDMKTEILYINLLYDKNYSKYLKQNKNGTTYLKNIK